MANIHLRNEKEKLCSVALHHTIENLVILENKGVRIGKQYYWNPLHEGTKISSGSMPLEGYAFFLSCIRWVHIQICRRKTSSACITVVYLLGWVLLGYIGWLRGEVNCSSAETCIPLSSGTGGNCMPKQMPSKRKKKKPKRVLEIDFLPKLVEVWPEILIGQRHAME